MYHQFFGLTSPPFRITPDTAAFYAGAEREALLNAVIYAINHGDGIIKVVGEVGSGKTMLTRMLEKQLPDSVTVIYLPNPSLPAEDLIFAIAHELKLSFDNGQGKTHVLQQVHAELLNLHAKQQRVVVFIDEAQCMPLDTLEELRLLSNLETETDKLLQLVLFGQPELDTHLSQPSVRQIRERIIHNFYLHPFSTDEVAEYLAFRLHKAGHNGPSLFSKGALKLLARYSRGLPRKLSILADKSLLAAYADQSTKVQNRHVHTAHRDDSLRAANSRSLAKALSVVLSVAALAGLTWLLSSYWPALENRVASTWAEPQAQLSAEPSPAGTTLAQERQSPQPAKLEQPEKTPATLTALIDPPPATDASTEDVINAGEAAAVSPATKENTIIETHKELKDSAQTSSVASNTPTLDGLLKKTRRWMHDFGDAGYTIQILSADGDDQAQLERFLNQVGAMKLEEEMFVHPVLAGDSKMYAVTLGAFTEYAEARRRARSLPRAIRKYRPYTKNIDSFIEEPTADDGTTIAP